MLTRQRIADYLEALASQRLLSPHTVNAYRRDLAMFADFLDAEAVTRWGDFTRAQLEAWIAGRREQGLSLRSLQRELSAVRGFYDWLARHDEAGLHPARSYRLRRLRQDLPQVLTVDSMQMLLDAPAPAEAAQRYTALLARRAAGRKQAVKTFIMDNRSVVGVGNIYAQESLFLAGIHPSRQAGRISAARYERLAEAIRTVLSRAIAAGGTTLRDFSRVDGQPGYFAQDLSVYGRTGEPCLICGTVLKGSRHGQRTTCYCPQCQR